MIGETISRYRIVKKLGAGGMGVVYLAQDVQLERAVALKFLPQETALSETDRDRFLREARSASSLDHPNIGVIHGIESTPDGQLFIIMAYYEGETLAQRLSRGLLPLPLAMNWACQIASGLAAAHARNIVHRDIKPSNIIITAEDSIRIVDFGLARVVATPSATMTAKTAGTLPYMAPEQILGEPVDQRCDVWALSILLVQMITGSHPFARENATAMSFAILNQPPVAIDALPTALQPIALHGLSKEPAHRYLTAKELLGDLQTVREQIASGMVPLDGPTLQHDPSPASERAAWQQVISHASTPRWQPTPSPSQYASSSAPQPAQRKVSLQVVAAVALLVFAAGSLLFPGVRQRAAALLSGTAAAKHVVVLPFDNIGNNPANEAVADGLMDSLTSKLSNLDAGQRSLWVVPASVVRSHKVTDPSAAAKDLGANLVVQGSIRRDGNNVQLTVNLIDANDLRQVGAAVLNDATGDLAALQDDAVAQLARLMKIDAANSTSQAQKERTSPGAYEMYLKALGLMQRYDKPGNLDQAIVALNDAVKTDPNFGLGYASLSEIYRLKNLGDPNPRWIEQAVAYGQQATRLDSRLGSAYVTLGKIHEDAGQHDLAVQEFQKALDLNRRDADALDGMAHSYENAGHLKEAEEAFKKAVALRPDSWIGYNSLALFYDRQNRFAEGIEQLKKAIALTPDNSQLYLNLAAFYLDTGDPKFWPEIERHLKKSIALSPSYPAYANLGLLYYDEKRYGESAATTEKALQMNDKNYIVWGNLVISYEWLGDKAKTAAARLKAIDSLESTIKLKPSDALAHSYLADFYAQQGNKDLASSHRDTALALSPNDPNVLSIVGDAFENLGDRQHAQEYLRKALDNGYPVEKLKNDPEAQPVLHDPSFRLEAKPNNGK
jgi:eukaryotic-like serine/threonine-protein kinase